MLSEVIRPRLNRPLSQRNHHPVHSPAEWPTIVLGNRCTGTDLDDGRSRRPVHPPAVIATPAASAMAANPAAQAFRTHSGELVPLHIGTENNSETGLLPR